MLKSKGRLSLAALACVGLAFAISTPAGAWDREIDTVQNFLVPSGAPMVEGLTVDSNGDVYTPTFNPNGSPPSQLFTFGPDGSLKNSVRIKGSSQAMLGLAFRPPGPPQTNELLIIDFGAGQVLSVNPNNGNAKPCITLPGSSSTGGPTQAGSGLNALTFDKTGAIYVSDSFQGVIWRFSPLESGSPCGQATAWVTDPLLAPNAGKQPESVPPFGANGVEFNNAQDTMFVCNTAIDTIVKIPFSGGNGGGHGAPVVFTNSINGCDGIAIDKNDNIWAAANQADEIVVVSSTGDSAGKVIAKLGDFDGLNGGKTKGLLFPASPAFSPDGGSLWVTNLELDLRTLGISQAVDSGWAAEVTQHSIAKIPVPTSFPFFSQ